MEDDSTALGQGLKLTLTRQARPSGRFCGSRSSVRPPKRGRSSVPLLRRGARALARFQPISRDSGCSQERSRERGTEEAGVELLKDTTRLLRDVLTAVAWDFMDCRADEIGEVIHGSHRTA